MGEIFSGHITQKLLSLISNLKRKDAQSHRPQGGKWLKKTYGKKGDKL
jgi:hypothetical protein